jgi:hypothetical protein
LPCADAVQNHSLLNPVLLVVARFAMKLPMYATSADMFGDISRCTEKFTWRVRGLLDSDGLTAERANGTLAA